MKKRKSSALIFVLKGFVPYTRENLLLSFKPGLFFAELEKTSGYPQSTLRTAFWRAQQAKLLTEDPIPKLTTKGRQKIQPFIATKLSGDARLMVIFDIPEASAFVRRQFRWLLRHLDFKQVQQSVWITDYDHRPIIEEAVAELGLGDCVEIHETVRLFPK